MAYTRVYENRINWENYPSVDTPLDEINLNKMDYALNQIDGTLESWDVTKANESDMLLAVKTIVYNDSNGQITITFFNGTSTVIDTLLEKVAVNFDYDDDPTSAHYQSLVITLDDGTVKYVDMSSLITQYEFIDSSTMHFTINQDGEITVDIIDGSITGAKLQPNYLADCVAAKTASQAAQTGAETAQGLAEGSAEDSEAWAVGQRNGQDVPSTDPAYHNNAKYWSEQANVTSFAALTDVSLSNLQNGDVPKWNATTQKWENGQGGSSTVDADDVTYDNTTSGLSATDVQDAIDEVVSMIPSVSYSNTVSCAVGATDVTFTDVTYSNTASYEVFGDDGTGTGVGIASIVEEPTTHKVMALFSNPLVVATTVYLKYWER